MTTAFKRDEQSRLADLRSLGILDTPAEERYDRFTRLTQRAFNVPFAMLSLIDEHREWFKSKQGVRDIEIPRVGSFCSEVIKQQGVMTIQDATSDTRFAAMARDRGIKFYAACPVRSRRGNIIGTLSIADTTPRVFNSADKACLQDLTLMVEEELTVQSIANIDDLTSLFNRRGFLGVGEHSIAICRRMHRPATMMFFDLDGFKQVNDTYGHAIRLSEFRCCGPHGRR